MGWEARAWELGSLVEKQAYRKTLGKGLVGRAQFIKVVIVDRWSKKWRLSAGDWLSISLILINLKVNAGMN